MMAVVVRVAAAMVAVMAAMAAARVVAVIAAVTELTEVVRLMASTVVGRVAGEVAANELAKVWRQRQRWWS